MHWERRAFFGVDDVILIWFAHRFYEIYSITSAVAPLVLARTLTGAFNSRRKIQRATAAIVTISERVRFEAHARCVAHRDDGTLGAGPHSGRRRVNSRHGRMSCTRVGLATRNGGRAGIGGRRCVGNGRSAGPLPTVARTNQASDDDQLLAHAGGPKVPSSRTLNEVTLLAQAPSRPV